MQRDGAERIARIASEEGVASLVHVSAIGADPESNSSYARTKGEGEAAVLAAYPGAMVVRPSVIFGPEDEFFNRFGAMSRNSPCLPIVGADTKFQPVYVDDVAQAIALGAEGKAAPGIYELGGADVSTFRELMGEMLEVVRRRRMVVGLPFWVGRTMGRVCDGIKAVTLGLAPTPITLDQVKQLANDNVVSGDFPGLSDLGIQPTSLDAILPTYLWQFRPSGQYAAVKESARNLRG